MNRLLLLSILFTQIAWSQEILLVDDNDYITQNSDSIKNALNASIYSGYDYYNISDVGGTSPTSDELLNYDLVIWYCSTDGSGLQLWNGDATASGNGEIIDYIIEEKPIWIIGSDMLFEVFNTPPDMLTSGDFAYDHMGIESYNIQSYGDDGSLGVSQVDLSAGTPSTTFKDSILWSFATHWWVDGVTPRTGGINFYEMGPDAYALANEITMFHYTEDLNNVMTTLFDPALIDNQANTVAFLEAGITYLLPDDLGMEEESEPVTIYPNPTNESFIIKNAKINSEIKIYSSVGSLVQSSILSVENEFIDISNLEAGMYVINFEDQSGNVKNTNLIVQ
ncbi:MAG: T9SS type A sorting domain-containing protein [Crocinitomicaceae bacterium]|nr:T9SS type A sorting domain-containing protein [Crocinitomicaceae bacterium]